MNIPAFRERLAPGLGVQLAASLAAPMTFLAVAPFGIEAAIVAGVLAATGLITLLQLRAPSIKVDADFLRAGRITIPTSVISGCESLSGHDAFLARGPNLDPRAARLIIGDIDGVVRLSISDSSDPTPYLLLSTRNPGGICAFISALGAKN